jgi:hypothetical protein
MFNISAVDQAAGTSPGSGLAKTWFKIDLAGTLTEYTGEFNLSGQTSGLHTIYFYSVDNVGNVESEQSIPVTLDDQGPTTNAGPDKTAEKDATLTLTASGSDQHTGVIASYSWSIEAPDGSVETLEGSTVQHKFSQVGDYTITLTMTDAVGNQGTDTSTVTVEGGGLGDFWWILVIVIVIIVVLIVVLLLLRKKKPAAAAPAEAAPVKKSAKKPKKAGTKTKKKPVEGKKPAPKEKEPSPEKEKVGDVEDEVLKESDSADADTSGEESSE